MVKLVFCDVDGVLNSEAGTLKSGVAGIEEDKLFLLKRLLEQTGAELVITSKARFSNTIYEDRLKAIEAYGIHIKDAFRGNGLTTTPKAVEVLAYLQSKCNGFDSFVVFDDNDSGFNEYMPNNFVKIDPRVGLMDQDIEKGSAILGSPTHL